MTCEKVPRFSEDHDDDDEEMRTEFLEDRYRLIGFFCTSNIPMASNIPLELSSGL